MRIVITSRSREWCWYIRVIRDMSRWVSPWVMLQVVSRLLMIWVVLWFVIDGSMLVVRLCVTSNCWQWFLISLHHHQHEGFGFVYVLKCKSFIFMRLHHLLLPPHSYVVDRLGLDVALLLWTCHPNVCRSVVPCRVQSAGHPRRQYFVLTASSSCVVIDLTGCLPAPSDCRVDRQQVSHLYDDWFDRSSAPPDCHADR